MSLRVEVITPERKLLDQEADFVAAPAFDGEIGILPGHAPLLTRLGHGELRIRRGANTDFLAISGGFLEVSQKNRVSVFAETADLAGQIDVERERQEAARAKAKLEQAKDLTAEELAAVEAALSRAVARLKVAGTVGRRRAPGNEPH